MKNFAKVLFLIMPGLMFLGGAVAGDDIDLSYKTAIKNLEFLKSQIKDQEMSEDANENIERLKQLGIAGSGMVIGKLFVRLGTSPLGKKRIPKKGFMAKVSRVAGRGIFVAGATMIFDQGFMYVTGYDQGVFDLAFDYIWDNTLGVDPAEAATLTGYYATRGFAEFLLLDTEQAGDLINLPGSRDLIETIGLVTEMVKSSEL